MPKKTKTQVPVAQGTTSDALPEVEITLPRKPPTSSPAKKRRSATADAEDVSMATSPILLPPRDTKTLAVRMHIRSPNGATLAALMELTGWQAHTVRAVISRLRKKGWEVVRRTEGSETVYYIDPNTKYPLSETDYVEVIEPASPTPEGTTSPAAHEGNE